MKAQSPIFRLLWGISVLLGTGIAAYFLTKLFILYFSRKVTISVDEKLATNTDFPSLTLCNLNPLANTPLDGGFLRDSLEVFRQYITSPDTRNEIDKYTLSEMTDPAAMYVNFVHNSGLELNAQNFVVTCRWDAESWETEPDCLLSMEMHVYQAKYGYCFTFEPPQNAGHISSFSAILYIDDSIEVAVPLFVLRTERTFATGAVLTAHRRDTLPDIDGGIILSAGTSSEVGISITRRKKLPNPFSQCEYKSNMPVVDNYAYTRGTCKALCYQEKVISECGCVDSLALSMPSQFENGVQYCNWVDISRPIDHNAQSIANLTSCLRFWSSRISLCDDVCPDECNDHRYELTRAEIEWPHPTSQIAFYDAYIRGKPYEERFQAYGNLSVSLGRGGKIPDLYDILWKERKMGNNFLEVSMELIKTEHWKLWGFVLTITKSNENASVTLPVEAA